MIDSVELNSSNDFILVVIPMRKASTRLPNKILTKIDEFTLGQKCYQRACDIFSQDSNIKIIVAVDNQEIKDSILAVDQNACVVMTDPLLPSGTDRVFSAYQWFEKELPQENKRLAGIINLQGDMPFVASQGLKKMVNEFRNPKSNVNYIYTLGEAFDDFTKLTERTVVKVLVNKNSEANYFSRFPIPYSRKEFDDQENSQPAVFKHIGVYGYSATAIAEFCAQPPVPAEKAEGLEQLRALWLGFKIKVLFTIPGKGESNRGIDSLLDLQWAQKKITESKKNV